MGNVTFLQLLSNLMSNFVKNRKMILLGFAESAEAV